MNLFLAARISSKFQQTTTFEAAMNKMAEDVQKYVKLKDSDKLNEFNKLNELVNSDEFIDKKKTFGAKFKDTEEGKQEQRYKDLKKDPDIIFMQKVDEEQINKYLQYELVFNDDFKWKKLSDSDWKAGFIYPHNIWRFTMFCIGYDFDFIVRKSHQTSIFAGHCISAPCTYVIYRGFGLFSHNNWHKPIRIIRHFIL